MVTQQVLINPVMDLSVMSTPSHQEFAEGYFLTHRRRNYFFDAYATAVQQAGGAMTSVQFQG